MTIVAFLDYQGVTASLCLGCFFRLAPTRTHKDTRTLAHIITKHAHSGLTNYPPPQRPHDQGRTRHRKRFLSLSSVNHASIRTEKGHRGHRERERDRQTDRQRERHTHTHTHTHTHRLRQRQRQRQRLRERKRERERERDRDRDRERERQRQRQRASQRAREKPE